MSTIYKLFVCKSTIIYIAGLYVLIDEHRNREKAKKLLADSKNKKKKDKKPKNPHKLQPKVRKPSRNRLSFSKSRSKSKKDKVIDNNVSRSAQSASPSKSIKVPKIEPNPLKKSQSTPNALKTNTPTPPIENTVSMEEYSISRTVYSEEDDDEDELKHSHSNSISNEQGNELSKSLTNSLKPQKIMVSSIPSPKPKPKDEEAERNMGRHLLSLVPFEPSDHKAVKSSISSKYNDELSRGRTKDEEQ